MRKASMALVAAVLSATAFLSCKDNYVDTTADTFSKDTTAIAAFAKTQPQNYLYAGAGVRYAITTPNTAGRLPASGDEAEVTYLITSLDGKYRADSTKKDSLAYFRFNIGSLPPGIDIGLSKTREGESAIYLIPSYAAFQSTEYKGLPANTPIRFYTTLRKLRSEDEQIADYITRNKLTLTTQTQDGVRICKTQAVATGSELVNGQTVSVRYTGKLLRYGTVFDSNVGKQLFEVALGSTSIIKGFESGIRALKVGEKATIVFPSSLGYGTAGYSVIPGYTPLAFDIEVVSVR
ncbi:FKBP-type peptidyl-prolyl cis-trans isomerase [Fibrella sp. WM1]|uniref:FKBP-type peptidyl-prolyl cis-trans isomerase n=1 Tax=Fibrella musci TaxID=3242485 RepID=UPI00351FD7BD